MKNHGSLWNTGLDAVGRAQELKRKYTTASCAREHRWVHELLALWITVGYVPGSQRLACLQDVVKTSAHASVLRHSMAGALGVRRFS